jgi:hypothetical protein
MKRDLQATAARQFGDPGSYVTPDNREILKGIDWTRRKQELWERCGGLCENILVAGELVIRCRQEANDAHHKVLRSRKRNDALDALLAVCRRCHQVLDAQQRKERHKR